MATNTFKDFLAAEIKKRDMSTREFARYVGVAHGTIGRFINHPPEVTGKPSVEFIEKLARATNTDPCLLLALVIPNTARHTAASPDALILSQRIEQLPEHLREAIDAILARYAET
jgi:transcriptional regulator with XRE-family HTH domain